MELDLAILNLNSIVTPVSSGPVRGRGMTRIECIKESNIGIMNGKIVYIGPEIPTAEKYIDGRGLIAIPGFIDCHTHIPFTGDRSREFLMRLEGKSYMDIMKAGGGIRSTSEAVRRTPATALMAESFRFLDSMLSLGVTTVEGKSGYGLEREGELKQLRVLEALGEIHPIDVFSTFLGAHALPEEYSSRDEYLSSMIEIFDEVRKLTDTIDIFCEDGVFNVDQSRRYMLAAIESGFRIRIHADELSSSGGGLLAVELGAVSADHLISADDITIQALAKSDTIATLLPGTSFFLNESFARGRELIDRGAIVAIASDFNPGSCNIYNPFIVMFLAVTRCGLKVEEAITA
ncbi:MAG TPA: imidazolonepropionase, partial [Mesotoga infera]|nr:imidazolonepropionase [Mesotoga infera]